MFFMLKSAHAQIAKIYGILKFRSPIKPVFYPVHKCKMATIFNIYEQIKFHAQLS